LERIEKEVLVYLGQGPRNRKPGIKRVTTASDVYSKALITGSNCGAKGARGGDGESKNRTERCMGGAEERGSWGNRRRIRDAFVTKIRPNRIPRNHGGKSLEKRLGERSNQKGGTTKRVIPSHKNKILRLVSYEFKRG